MILVRLVMESHVSSIVSQVVCFHWPKDTQLTLRWSTIHDDCWAQPIKLWIFSSSGKTRPRTVLFTQNIIGQNRSYHNKAHISSVFFSFLNVSIHTHIMYFYDRRTYRDHTFPIASVRDLASPQHGGCPYVFIDGSQPIMIDPTLRIALKLVAYWFPPRWREEFRTLQVHL